MKWFRTNVRQGSRLALFALAIQFVLSFGHFHESHVHVSLVHESNAQEAPGDGMRHVARSAAAHVSHGVWHADASRAVRSNTSPDRPSDRRLADGCSICAVLALADAMLSATPPDLPAPQAAEFAYLITNAHSVDLDSAGAAFQPRAPPIA
jgi:hypothetical protein